MPTLIESKQGNAKGLDEKPKLSAEARRDSWPSSKWPKSLSGDIALMSLMRGRLLGTPLSTSPRPTDRAGSRSGMEAKPEAADLEHELPQSAENSPSSEHNLTTGFDAQQRFLAAF